jgi:hypothetical protein
MEEILASIRRIIADDDAGKTVPQPSNEMRKGAAQKIEPPKVELPRVEPVKREPPKPEPVKAEPVKELPKVIAPAAPPPQPAAIAAAPEPLGAVDFEAEAGAGDILDLTESMAAPAPELPAAPPPEFHKIDGFSDVGFDDVVEHPAEASYDSAIGSLLSSEARGAVNTAFNALAQTVLVQNARTLEDLVREMLRPMLKTWLDDNLPGMVERLVRAEIERVSRGRT